MRLLAVTVLLNPDQRDYAERLKELLEQTLAEDEVEAYVHLSVVAVPSPN